MGGLMIDDDEDFYIADPGYWPAALLCALAAVVIVLAFLTVEVMA
jgi:hypothetical protein